MSETKEYVSCTEEQGTIHISEDVLAVIAAAAALEIEGVSSLVANLGSDLAEMLGKKNLARGVSVAVDGESVTVDIDLMVKYGFAIQEVARTVQGAVANSVESMSGLHVSAVNVTISGITFEKKA